MSLVLQSQASSSFTTRPVLLLVMVEPSYIRWQVFLHFLLQGAVPWVFLGDVSRISDLTTVLRTVFALRNATSGTSLKICFNLASFGGCRSVFLKPEGAGKDWDANYKRKSPDFGPSFSFDRPTAPLFSSVILL